MRPSKDRLLWSHKYFIVIYLIIFGSHSKKRFIECFIFRIKECKDYPDRRVSPGQLILYGANGDFCCQFPGKAVDPGRNVGKGNTRTPVNQGKFNAPGITAGQEFLFPILTSTPYRSHRMDHMAGGEPEPWCDFGIAGLASIE